MTSNDTTVTNSTTAVRGLHHVTVIAGDAQENLDFYTQVLGMRLVKRSVNQDDPGTYHLFYADGEAHPGSDLTFFPWAHMPRGRPGVGLTDEVALAVPTGSLDYWADRLAKYSVRVGARVTRFGEAVLPFADPHGLSVALVESGDDREFTPWHESPVPADKQVRRLHSVRIMERELEPTVSFIQRVLGYKEVSEEDGWHRFAVAAGGSGQVLDIKAFPDERRGVWGVGSIHHVAFRVPDDAEERVVQDQVFEAGGRATQVIDRFWFKSVYFKEPGGALFEIATDGPGFMVDESAETLGEALVLPPFLEEHRAEIEQRLPRLHSPRSSPG